PVTFQNFELPARIGFGGAQRLAVHHLPGGARVIDAMGRDDAPILWSGAFAGPDAADRARLLDLLRVEGLPLPLAWDEFAYLVVIARFEAIYERPNWVPYRIACTVLLDQTQAVTDVAVPLIATLGADLSAAGGVVETGAAQAALTVPGAATLGTSAYDAAVQAVGAAQGAAQAGMAGAGAALTAAGDPVSAATAAGQLAQMVDANGFLSRAASNLANALS
ncbi:MAG TPA: hypothetical protein VFN46_09305, partial [Acetobacteraceae bacterium]|nr:hypothetical protein [Acetobacteraceae bacterium]